MTRADKEGSSNEQANVFVAKLLQMATAESAGREGIVRLSCAHWMQCALTSPDILRCFEINAPLSPLDSMRKSRQLSSGTRRIGTAADNFEQHLNAKRLFVDFADASHEDQQTSPRGESYSDFDLAASVGALRYVAFTHHHRVRTRMR
jgi:hypothetical protein|tara:strand:+ start:135 stop:578 length:444 start_codon:yes stop_codon:yes gene_type:complete